MSPSRYEPNDLGTNTVDESDGQTTLTLSTQALEYLDVDEGQEVEFLKGGFSERLVMCRVVDED